MNTILTTNRNPFFIFAITGWVWVACQSGNQPAIDRLALVHRHNPVLHKIDTLGSLTVGNGEFAFTVDASGLQTFPDAYENGIPLGTQAQWGWHSFPNTKKYNLRDVENRYASCDATTSLYPVQHSSGRAGDATTWLRSNPHRLHLGLTGLVLLKENGNEVSAGDLQNIDQELDLWAGKIKSTYEIDGVPVAVEVYAHQQLDMISTKIVSSLITKKRLKVRFRFPYAAGCHTCAGYDWDHPEKHSTTILSASDNRLVLERKLDSTTYFVDIAWNTKSRVNFNKPGHLLEITPAADQASFELSVRYSRVLPSDAVPSFDSTRRNSERTWGKFWSEGGAIDFSACSDPRAAELERRVVLSQYLTRIQGSGSLPPQETGLTMNSWFGKFHLEMHWWHSAHFALWGKKELLEKSMSWYSTVLERARATAAKQGYEGVRWPKMTDPAGRESPSDIGAFLVWQQPHPIYYAELLYRLDSSRVTLEKYRDIVMETAAFMASFARYNPQDKKYHLCHPLIPAQEIFKAMETDDPAYELAYWQFGLEKAQQWRKRLGLEPDQKWQNVLDNLAPLPVNNNLYLPVATAPEAYQDDRFRTDHPSVTAAFGFLPNSSRVDTTIMKNTFHEIMKRWNWETTWGWDYPMLAMTAVRLNEPEKAIDALLMDVEKNTYLVNGHNYQDKRLRLYLPGNGGLLAAVAMMAAGWDGNTAINPGFPKNGKWNVRWEGLEPLP